ncbi:MAG: ParB/RepB/Spo0J family partition protein [Dehalococcoidia bacterium]
MGKRVNLAELAREEVPDTYSPPPPPSATSSGRQPDASGLSVDLESTSLAVADIATNPLNSRDPAEDGGEEFNQLVATIREHGVLQPIVVCSVEAFVERYPGQRRHLQGARWVALIGNRRLRASVAAGQARVPALVNDDRLASMFEVMLIENSHRKDLSVLHEASAMKTVLTAEKMTQAQLAKRIGRTPMYVSQRLALLGLIPALQAALEDGSLKVEQARQLGTLPDAEQHEIAAVGPPYRAQSAPAAAAARPAAPRRRFTAETPAQAAESIRKLFTADELAELIRLLGEQPH